MKSRILLLFVLVSALSLTVFSQHEKIEIIQTGGFHEEEISSESGEIWFGLFKQNERFSLIPVTITVVNYYERDTENDEGQRSDKIVKVDGMENPVFLIRGANFLDNRQIKTVFGESEQIKNNFNKSFDFNGKKYELFVESRKRNEWENPQILNETSKLILRQGKTEQIIYQMNDCDDCHWEANWIGDLDNDGKLDFFMYLSDHYNRANMKLFLSSEAENGKLVKEVAEFTTTGC